MEFPISKRLFAFIAAVALTAMPTFLMATSTTPFPFGTSGHKICFLDTNCVFSGTILPQPENNIVTISSASQTLTNPDCNSHVLGYSVSVGVINLPTAPKQGCTFAIEPNAKDILLRGNGSVIRLPGFSLQDITVMRLYYMTENTFLRIAYNGTRWAMLDKSNLLFEQSTALDNPRIANGQVRLDYDGSTFITLCPKNGPGGIIIRDKLFSIPSGCLKYNKSGATSSALSKIFVQQEAIAATVTGAASHGGLIQLTISNSDTAGDRVALLCFNIDGTVEANGLVSGDVIDGTHIDEVGSTFTNAYTSGGNCKIVSLLAASTAHAINSSGVEADSLTGNSPFVGLVWEGAAHALADTATQRDVASWYNRKIKTCVNKYTADRTTTSTSYVELNSEIECEFVTFGDDDVAWSLTGSIKNNTSSDGTAVTAGFDGTTPETEETAIINAVGSLITVPASAHGSKTGLSEGKHYITLLGKAITGGTSTVFGTTPVTSLEARVPQ
jgi:hypothetical protein